MNELFLPAGLAYLRLDPGMALIRLSIYRGRGGNHPVTLVRVESHSLGLGVSISPLVALVSVEWHSLGLGS